MIGLQQFSRGLAEYLAEKTGAAAFSGRVEHPVYPALTVEAEDRNTIVLAGGRQIQRELAATVACYPSRRRGREEGQDLAGKVMEAVIPGFIICERGFCPENLKISREEQEIYRVTFDVTFCDFPENWRKPVGGGERMERLSLRICRGKEEN